ncbi:MAG: hypothetical protein ACJAVS_000502 [Paracoccaceae bacterium]|jgi:hypothetical protein
MSMADAEFETERRIVKSRHAEPPASDRGALRGDFPKLGHHRPRGRQRRHGMEPLLS